MFRKMTLESLMKMFRATRTHDPREPRTFDEALRGLRDPGFINSLTHRRNQPLFSGTEGFEITPGFLLCKHFYRICEKQDIPVEAVENGYDEMAWRHASIGRELYPLEKSVMERFCEDANVFAWDEYHEKMH